MTRELTLTSAEDGSTLQLAVAEGTRDSVVATATGVGFSISAPVYTYMAPSLPDFMESLAGTPSSGAKEVNWSSLEGDLNLAARLDSLGHVFLTYDLRSPDIGSNRWWRFTGRLVLELGAMPQICRDARAFWQAAT
jgi:hypothetical protein